MSDPFDPRNPSSGSVWGAPAQGPFGQQQPQAPMQQPFGQPPMSPYAQQPSGPFSSGSSAAHQGGLAQMAPMAAAAPMTVPLNVDPNLGSLRAQFRGSWMAGGWMIYVGVLMVINGGVVGFKVIEMIASEQTELLETMVPTLGISLVIAGVLLFLSALRWRQCLSIFDQGLHHKSLLGAKTIFFREIRAVRHEVTVYKGSRRDHLRIELHSGARVNVSDLPDCAKIAPMLPGYVPCC